MDRREQIQLINKAKKILPKDYVRILSRRLVEKGFIINPPQIQHCLNSEKSTAENNSIIMAEFIAFVEETKANNAEQLSKLKELVA